MDINAKYRPFYIAKLLEELTDENHYLTTVQIMRLLEERYGITTHRQTIAQDIEVLKTVGIDICCIASTQNRYKLLGRKFDDAELKLLIDAVASSKFISKKRSEVLAAKLASLASNYKADELKRNISVESRVKSENEQTLLIIDGINEAINRHKQIRFQYFRYNDGYFIATAIPKSEMFSARTPVSVVTAVTSLVLILILLGTVTFTSEEEEMLYATMSDSQEEKGFESTIFQRDTPVRSQRRNYGCCRKVG